MILGNISFLPLIPSPIKMDVKKGRLLIVDDEPDITNYFSLALEGSGLFEVDPYNDSLEALSNFKANSYDLVLLDIRIPVMNGFELYKNIKAIEGWAKVCFLTAVNGLSEYKIHYTDIIKEIECGKIDCCMDKPVASTQFLNRIRKVIS